MLFSFVLTSRAQRGGDFEAPKRVLQEDGCPSLVRRSVIDSCLRCCQLNEPEPETKPCPPNPIIIINIPHLATFSEYTTHFTEYYLSLSLSVCLPPPNLDGQRRVLLLELLAAQPLRRALLMIIIALVLVLVLVLLLILLLIIVTQIMNIICFLFLSILIMSCSSCSQRSRCWRSWASRPCAYTCDDDFLCDKTLFKT